MALSTSDITAERRTEGDGSASYLEEELGGVEVTLGVLCAVSHTIAYCISILAGEGLAEAALLEILRGGKTTQRHKKAEIREPFYRENLLFPLKRLQHSPWRCLPRAPSTRRSLQAAAAAASRRDARFLFSEGWCTVQITEMTLVTW